MTRDQVLAKTRALIEGACAHQQAKLVVDMALRGVPAQQLLDAYLFAIEWNEQAVVDGLKEAERIIDEALADSKISSS